MFGLPLTVAAPAVLVALAALPAIWLLLRVTPPQPRRIDFPPLKILADLLPRQDVPARTPPWLLLLRLVAAALLILAVAGPLWNPRAAEGSGPLLLFIDNGVPAAQDWRVRMAYAEERVLEAGRQGRPVAIVPSASPKGPVEAVAGGAALERLRAVRPEPRLVDRGGRLQDLRRFLQTGSGIELVWIADGAAGLEDESFAAALSGLGASVRVAESARASALAVAGVDNGATRLVAHLVRVEPNGRDFGTVRALDARGLPLADAAFRFAPDATTADASFELPIELRNAIARVEILDERSAGAVVLVDESGKRRRVGIVSGGTADQAQPLLAPTFYLERALAPYADLRQGHGAAAEQIAQLLDQQISVLVLADIGTLDRDTRGKVESFVERGGTLLRFAGTRLAAGNDDLVPVRLRRGGRNLGGALSWDAPKTLQAFGRESPFHGVAIPADLGVRRQILAEPDGDLGRKTWASLADGTPIVTADRRGEGLLVLVHVTADATWSNLPLTGLYVDMLRRIVGLSGASAPLAEEARRADATIVAPTRVLDGFGTAVAPPTTARGIPHDYAGRATEDHPPGFYGPTETARAVNALLAGDRLRPLDLGPLAGSTVPLAAADTIDLRAPLLVVALLLLAADTLASLCLGGHLARFRRLVPLHTPRMLALAVLAALLAQTGPGWAQSAGRPAPSSALVTRLAYVVTGDGGIDGASKAGLVGLTEQLASRTALNAGEPVAIDLARDELAFYPILYLPIAAGRPDPSEAAIRKLDSYMKGGGTVIFDTRDALSVRPGGAPTPEAQALRRMLATLDVPELEPVPRDHVLTKTFYLLDRFPGRYASGQTWVEALPPVVEGERRPARAGDGVSPIVITGNDLAAAWAVGRTGEPLYPTVGPDPRQREMAYRGGINLVIYTLTGNYKADQVHVPALLERLGQ